VETQLSEFWWPAMAAAKLWPVSEAEGRYEHEWRDERGWREFAASNRERIVANEHEINRLRDRVHDISEKVGVIGALTVQLGHLAETVEGLSRTVTENTKQSDQRTAALAEELSRGLADLNLKMADAVKRPTASVIAQYLALAVSIVAIVVVALTR
jgi:uncharacterized coiled-coil protein SlyX